MCTYEFLVHNPEQVLISMILIVQLHPFLGKQWELAHQDSMDYQTKNSQSPPNHQWIGLIHVGIIPTA